MAKTIMSQVKRQIANEEKITTTYTTDKRLKTFL